MGYPPGETQPVDNRPIVFGMKNADGVFPSLPARNEWGESWREGKLDGNGLLSPPSPPFGEEREKESATF